MNRREVTVVVVDDDAHVLHLVENILRESGFTVYGVGSAAGALEALDHDPDAALLLTDVVMPSIDGIMLADMIKFRHPTIRVLYMTGFGEKAGRERGVYYGPTILKPFRADQLVTAVEMSCAGNA